MSFKGIINMGWNYICTHKFGVLTGASLIGLAASVTTSALAARNVVLDIADAQFDYEENGGQGELPKKEKAKIIVKDSVGAVTTTVTTGALIILQYKEGSKQIQNGLLAINALSEVREVEKLYRRKVAERLGEKEERNIRNSVNEEIVKKLPYDDGTVEITGNGNTLMCDAFGERYFRSSVEAVLKGFDKWKRIVESGQEDFVNFNELYYYWDLKYNQAGNCMGCFADNFPDELKKTTCIGPNNEPCLVWYIDDEYLACEKERC